MGAGGSLVVAGLICLIAVSAMLGYRGWPGTDAARPDGSLSLRTPEAKAGGRAASGPVPAAVLTSATATPDGGGATAGTRADAPRRSGRDRGRSRDRGPSAGTPQPPATTTPPAAGTQPAPGDHDPARRLRRKRRLRLGWRRLGSRGGSGSGGGGGGGAAPAPGPVEQVVGTGRQTVNSLTAPLPVPPAAQQPVNDVLDTTEGVARTVDDVVAEVPVVGDTVGGVTGILLP